MLSPFSPSPAFRSPQDDFWKWESASGAEGRSESASSGMPALPYSSLSALGTALPTSSEFATGPPPSSPPSTEHLGRQIDAKQGYLWNMMHVFKDSAANVLPSR